MMPLEHQSLTQRTRVCPSLKEPLCLFFFCCFVFYTRAQTVALFSIRKLHITRSSVSRHTSVRQSLYLRVSQQQRKKTVRVKPVCLAVARVLAHDVTPCSE